MRIKGKRLLIFPISMMVIIFGAFFLFRFITNPLRNYEKMLSVYTYSTQLLCPEVSSFYVEPRSSPFPDLLGRYRQPFMIATNNEQLTGTLSYDNGRISAEYIQNGGVSIHPVAQEYFISSSADSLLLADKNATFMVTLGFNSPMDFDDFLDLITPVLVCSDNWDYGIQWIGIKTTEDIKELALGIPGDLTFNYLGDPQGKDVRRQLIEGGQRVQADFRQRLRILGENQMLCERFLESGIYGDISVPDFEARYQFVDNEELQVIGAVLLLDLELLEVLPVDQYKIIDIYDVC